MVGGLVLPRTVMAALIRLGHDSCRAPDLRIAPVCARVCRGRGKPQAVHPEQPYEKAEDEQPAEPQQWLREMRADVLDAVYQKHPERFVRKPPEPPEPPKLPEAVWINKPDEPRPDDPTIPTQR